jgi:hypothetical protein
MRLWTMRLWTMRLWTMRLWTMRLWTMRLWTMRLWPGQCLLQAAKASYAMHQLTSTRFAWYVLCADLGALITLQDEDLALAANDLILDTHTSWSSAIAISGKTVDYERLRCLSGWSL